MVNIKKMEGEVKTVHYFVDNYPRVVDEKGRMILPAKVREKLDDTVFITRSLGKEKCLYVYPKDEWQEILDKLKALPITVDPNAAAFVRAFSGRAKECAVDKQGRVNIDADFLKHAQIEKNIMLVGVNSRLEIWSAELWEEYQQSISEEFIMEGITKYELNI